MRPLLQKISPLLVAIGCCLAATSLPSTADAQVRAAEISEEQAAQAPYRDSGRLTVRQGRYGYLGSATYIRRYTGLTAGHMLYSGQAGLSTNVLYAPALFGELKRDIPVAFFAVLSGYQAAARVDDSSDAAFERDMGYLVLSRPADNNEWAHWSADPQALTHGSSFYILGYAAESFDGDELAQIRIGIPYALLRSPGLYESTGYYSEEGMSGGPVYATYNGGGRVAAVTVGGTSPPSPAYSDVRAITPEEEALFLEAEYAQGMVKGGFIKRHAVAARGSSILLKTGVIFADGARETANFSSRYDEVKLSAKGLYKNRVHISKVASGRYQVTFASDIPGGQSVPFTLTRTTVAQKGQTELATYNVLVQ